MTADKASPTKADATPSSGQYQQPSANAITYPEGGTQAWLVVAGSFVAMFCTFGSISTFGLLLIPRLPTTLPMVCSLTMVRQGV
jgi:hypothetical protein